MPSTREMVLYHLGQLTSGKDINELEEGIAMLVRVRKKLLAYVMGDIRNLPADANNRTIATAFAERYTLPAFEITELISQRENRLWLASVAYRGTLDSITNLLDSRENNHSRASD